MNKSGKEFIYSLSPGGDATVAQAQQVNSAVHMYRVVGDWHGPNDNNRGWQVISSSSDQYLILISSQDHLTQASAFTQMIGAPGWKGLSWPDLDMLAEKINDDASHKFEMTLWSIARSPLIIGRDIRNKTAQDLWAYTNAEVLEVSGNSTNNRPVANQTDAQTIVEAVWAADHAVDGSLSYVALFNPTKATRSISVSFAQLGLSATTCAVRDLWAHAELGTSTSKVGATVQPSGAALLQLHSCA